MRPWNSKTENARSEVMVESAPVTRLTYVFAHQVSILSHLQKYFLSIFYFVRLVILGVHIAKNHRLVCDSLIY